MRVRKAVLDDARAIAKINVDTWRSAYQGLIPDEILDKMSYDDREELVKQFLEADEKKIFTYVAEDISGLIAGYVMGGPERFNNPSYDGEIYAVYIQNEYQRRGIGRLLIREVAKSLQTENISSVIVWVLSNSPFKSFYKSIAGQELETKVKDLGGFQGEITAYGWQDISRLTELNWPEQPSHIS